MARARTPLADSIRREVWLRDEGCCVDCGAHRALEFSHARPAGRRAARASDRLQLRCAACGESTGTRL